jgi:glycerophosphoryl diester phosphodiesterase
VDPILRPPIGFAHRGARAHAPENTLEAFRLALKLGATGLESDVWLTADGVAVLDHDGKVRRKPVDRVPRADLPEHIPTLAELFDACGTDYDLSLDVKAPDAAAPTIAAAQAAGFDLRRLWLCHPDWEVAAAWRELTPDVRLVDSTRRTRMREGPERRAANLAEAGIDAVNMHHSDWTGGLTTLFHRFEVLAFAWDAQHERVLTGVLRMGVDAVYSDWVDRMMEALQKADR